MGLYREALSLYRQAGNQAGLLWVIERVGVLTALHGELDQATRLLAAAPDLRKSLEFPMGHVDSGNWNKAIAAAKTTLPEASFTSLWEEGRAMPIDQILVG